jgi:hypothetical protein
MKLGEEKGCTKKATHKVSIRDLEWAAGFLEGEGCFRQGRVMAPQVQIEPLKRLLKMFGGSITGPRRPLPRNKGTYLWRVSGARGRGVSLTLFSLMSSLRQKQIVKSLT